METVIHVKIPNTLLQDLQRIQDSAAIGKPSLSAVVRDILNYGLKEYVKKNGRKKR